MRYRRDIILHNIYETTIDDIQYSWYTKSSDRYYERRRVVIDRLIDLNGFSPKKCLYNITI